MGSERSKTVKLWNCIHTTPYVSLMLSAASYAKRSYLEAQLKRVTVVMPLDLHRSLKLKGFEQERTMNEIICTAVHQYMRQCGSKSSIPPPDN